jgi:hypothetical protein
MATIEILDLISDTQTVAPGDTLLCDDTNVPDAIVLQVYDHRWITAERNHHCILIHREYGEWNGLVDMISVMAGYIHEDLCVDIAWALSNLPLWAVVGD